MTQHPSLRGSQTGSKFRAVLKRYEKVKELDENEKWDEEKDSVYKLPKLRRIKFKIKKTAKAAEGEGAAGEAAAGAPAAAGGAKPAAGGAKPAAGGAKPAAGGAKPAAGGAKPAAGAKPAGDTKAKK